MISLPVTKLVFNTRFVRIVKILLINIILLHKLEKVLQLKTHNEINFARYKHTKCVANIDSIWLSHAWYDLNDINRRNKIFNH